MKLRIMLAAAFLSAGLGLATSAEAFPVGVALSNSDNPLLQHVAMGCGPGMTLGPYGHCRPKFTCPPGFHPGPKVFIVSPIIVGAAGTTGKKHRLNDDGLPVCARSPNFQNLSRFAPCRFHCALSRSDVPVANLFFRSWEHVLMVRHPNATAEEAHDC